MNRHLQQGLTLIEMLVAATISLVVAAAMVLTMSNTLGTGTQTIQQTRLMQEIRTAMQIMTRELRRANYHASYMSCYGDIDCRTTLGIAAKVKQITIDNGNNCFYFWYDRDSDGGFDTDDYTAAFRRVVESGAGKIQMTSTDSGVPTCNASATNNAWVDITDPRFVNITALTISDAASYTEVYDSDGNTLDVEKIAITITAELLDDPSIDAFLKGAADRTERQVTNFVRVRNDTTNLAP